MLPRRGAQTEPNRPEFAFFWGGKPCPAAERIAAMRSPSPGGAAYSYGGGWGGGVGEEDRLCSPPPGAVLGAAAMV